MAQDNERFKWRQDPATCLWTLPKAGDQTVKKHDLYAEYLKEYLRIVGEGAWKSKRVRVTVIDAFAGGGEYDAEDAGQSLVPGSPLRLLRAAEEAEQALLERDPSYDVEVRFWFNDAKRDNADHLRQVLGREGYTIDGKRIRGDDGTVCRPCGRDDRGSQGTATEGREGFGDRRPDRVEGCDA